MANVVPHKVAQRAMSTNVMPVEVAEKAWEMHRLGFVIFTAITQLAAIVLFWTVTEYSDVAKGSSASNAEDLTTFYPFFQDVNVMIFVGFGFLMTFLYRYGFSSVGYNFVVSAFCVQWAVLFSGFFERVWEGSEIGPHPGHGFDHPLSINIISMIKSLFAAGAVLISMGACLGKTTATQLLVMAFCELLFFAANETICALMLKSVDMGGSFIVHTFGAYFGLAVSRAISKAPKEGEEDKDEKSSRLGDMTAMIGTLFLWMFWPSFNGALAGGDQQQRVAINTFFALAACCVAAFMMDAALRPGHKFDMVSIQNATLAGGVAVGSSADLAIQPGAAVTIGALAGMLSVIGYVYIQPGLGKCMGLHDTCGVHNLHGMPGVLGAISGVISAAAADTQANGGSYVDEAQMQGIWLARSPCQDNSSLPDWNPSPFCNVTAGEQAGLQFASLAITLVIAILGGTITGVIIKASCLLPPYHEDVAGYGNAMKRNLWFQDKYYWAVPESDDEELDIEARRRAGAKQAEEIEMPGRETGNETKASNEGPEASNEGPKASDETPKASDETPEASDESPQAS